MASECNCCGCILGAGVAMGGYFSEGKTADSGCECTAGRCRNCRLCEVHCDCPSEWCGFSEEGTQKIEEVYRCPQCNCTWNRVIGVKRLKERFKELRKCKHCGQEWEVIGAK